MSVTLTTASKGAYDFNDLSSTLVYSNDISKYAFNFILSKGNQIVSVHSIAAGVSSTGQVTKTGSTLSFATLLATFKSLTEVNKDHKLLLQSINDKGGQDIYVIDLVNLSETIIPDLTATELQLVRNIIAAEFGTAVIISTAPLTGAEIINLRAVITAFSGAALVTTSDPLTTTEIIETRLIIASFTS